MNEFRNSPADSVPSEGATEAVPAAPADSAVPTASAVRAGAAAALAALAPCLLFGSAAFLTWFTAKAAWLLAPSALGLPFGPPPLRAVPLGEQPWSALLVDLAAVALLAAVTSLRTARAARRRPDARARTALSAWGAFATGAALAGALRGVVPAAAMALGPVGWAGYAAGGLVSGLLWGAALGWVCALAVAAAHRPRTARAR